MSSSNDIKSPPPKHPKNSKRRRLTKTKPPPSDSSLLPSGSAHYEVSYMHRSLVTRAVYSDKYGYLITCSDDGILKFWKRTAAPTSGNNNAGSGSTDSGGGNKNAPPSKCVEFVKSYQSHSGPILSLTLDHSGHTAATVGMDDTIQFYDVSTFDVTGTIQIPQNSKLLLGMHSAFITKEQSYLAVSSRGTSTPGINHMDKKEGVGAVYIFDSVGLNPMPVQVISLHGATVSAMQYNYQNHCVISCDVSGIIEIWDCTLSGAAATNHSALHDEQEEGTAEEEVVTSLGIGNPPTQSNNGIKWTSKFSTGLYDLCKIKSRAIALCISPNGTKFCIYTSDSKIKLFDYSTGKCKVTYDESVQVYEGLQQKAKQHNNDSSSEAVKEEKYAMDAMEYGKRAATEREICDTPIYTGGVIDSSILLTDVCGSQLFTMSFDNTGNFLLYPTILGVKILDINRHKCVRVVGKGDASQQRFIGVCLCQGEARVDKQMELARTGGSSAAIDHDLANQLDNQDAILVTLAYKKKRCYIFSNRDPIEGTNQSNDDDHDAEAHNLALVSRDVLNEPPDAEDLIMAQATNASSSINTQNLLGKEATLRTTMGDIHIKLYGNECPRTVENFCSHARNGYYDNVIFHRIIKGFMIQTGDPLGDGTGGESVWGGEFEDEFVRDLRHDRPFTVSMANAGPNTNGSQFFITTVPTPWLDNKHSVFGRVVRGMDICSAIENTKVDDGDKPLDEISILSMDIM